MISQDVLRSGGGSHRVFLQKLGDEGGLGRRIWHDLSLYHQSLLALERRQFQAGHYKRILAVSEEVKRELLDVYAVPEDKVTVIYNGVDEKRFHLSLRDKFRELIRKQWHIPLDAPTGLICGKRVPPEGSGRLLKVWSSPQMKDTSSSCGWRGCAARQIPSAGRGPDPWQSGLRRSAGRRGELLRRSRSIGVAGRPRSFWQCGSRGVGCGFTCRGESDCRRIGDSYGKTGGRDYPSSGGSERNGSQVVGNARARPRSGFFLEARKLAEGYSWSMHFRKLDRLLKDTVEPGGREPTS